MKTKSFPVRSSRKSFDPCPPLPERFGSEIDPDTVPPHQCPLGEDIRGPDPGACIVCEVSDERVSRCSGVDCLVRFHGECLTPEFGGNEDLANPFCPYCWFQFVSVKSKSLREEAICAEKALYKYLGKDNASGQGLQGEHGECSSKEDQFDKNSHQPEYKGTDMGEDKVMEDEFEASSEDEEMVAADNNVQDAEGNDELAQVQTRVSQVQQNENGRIRRRVEISTTMEPDGEDVSEPRAATNVAAQPNTLRAFSFFNMNQRRRLLWTPEEEEMLKMGVERFAAEARKNMPWRKILEMGENVFHPKRTSADLKDKWRNILKAQH